MRDAVSDHFQAFQAEEWREQQQLWVKRWQERARTDTDAFAGLAWLHKLALNQEMAWQEWDRLIKRERHALHMANHYALVRWVADTRLEQDKPYTEWEARCNGEFGNALLQVSIGSREINIRRAIVCYDAALQVFTKDSFPYEWATTQNNKGTAFADLPSGDLAQNLKEAIICFDAALQIYTKESSPREWAMTQNSKGNTLSRLPLDANNAHLREAIACYDAALTVYTQNTLARNWAKSQSNKGLALAKLSSGDVDENLRQAIACFDAALTIVSRNALPEDWAGTLFNKALVLEKQQLYDEAYNCFINSIIGFSAVGQFDMVAQVRNLLKRR